MKYMLFNIAVAGTLIYLVIGNDLQHTETEVSIATPITAPVKETPTNEIAEEIFTASPVADLAPEAENFEEDMPLIEVSTPITHKPVLDEVRQEAALPAQLSSQKNDMGQMSQAEPLMSPQSRQKELDKLVQSLELIFLEQTN